MSKCKITGKVLSVRIGREETQLLLVGKGSEILYSAAVPTPTGAVEDGMIRNQDAVRDMLKTAMQVPELKRVRQVVFSLCTTQVITELVTIPDLPAAKMEKLLQSNADMYFPVDTKDYQMVWEVLGPKGDGSTKEVEVQLWAVPIGMITRYYTVANACGLSVAAVDYCGHSIATAVGATFARPAGKAAKQAKQKKKLDLNAEISFGKKKKEEAPEETQEEAPVTGASDTELYLLLENDLLGMTFVQNGQVMLQRFIRCGSQPSYQFGEMAMMLEYFRAMDIGRGTDIRGIVAGELAKDSYIVGDLEDMLGIRLRPLDTNYDPPWCLCYGAAHTTIDFGSQSLNSAAMSKGHMRSQLGQYVAILVCGLVLLAVVMFTMTSKLGWDTELNTLRTTQQTLMMTSAKYSGFADNYYDYERMYTEYSEDWDTIFGSLQTYNDNMVLVLEELENLIPEKSSVTSMQMVSNALNVTFACSNKEEAAYLIMALREMEYADLIAVSNLTGGGRGAADSYGDPNYEGYYTATEKPPVEGSATLDGSVTVEAVVDPSQATEATRDPNEESDEFIMNMIGFLGGMLTSGTETPAPDTSVPEVSIPASSETVLTPDAEADDFITKMMEELGKYLNNEVTVVQNILEENYLIPYLNTGSTGYETLDRYLEEMMVTGQVDTKLDFWLTQYVNSGTTGIDALDDKLEQYLKNKTTGNTVMDTAIENFIWGNKANANIKTLYKRYKDSGTTKIPEVDALVEEFKNTGTTGIQKLDVKIKECVAAYNDGTSNEPTVPDNSGDSNASLDTILSMTPQLFNYYLDLYNKTGGKTGNDQIDLLLNAFINSHQIAAQESSKNSTSGGTAVTDTRVFFSAVLGYNGQLLNAELSRKGLSYTDKILPMEVNE